MGNLNGKTLDQPRVPYAQFGDKKKERPSVAILLCTYYGQRYLREQLDSLAAQTLDNWVLFVSDDGSEDKTLEILDAYKKNWPAGRLIIQSGPQKGVAANFLSMVCKAEIIADYFAFSDQDDIWEVDKLERATRWLESIPATIPAMYCSRAQLVDANNNQIGFSPLPSRLPSFANALVQNISSGNTMVFNSATIELIREAGPKVPAVIHDWWVYMVVSGCGGHIFYDSYPSIRYRQHAGNLIGMSHSRLAWISRTLPFWRGCHRRWNDQNIAALRKISGRLTQENQETFENFILAREKGILLRLIKLKASGVYMQTFFGNVALIVAAILKKL